MKRPAKSDNPKRELRLKGKKSHNQKAGYGTKRNPASSIQKTREEIEPEGEQKRLKKMK
jgi:hypothetical protein